MAQATQVPVTFDGAGSGEGPLSWGQKDIWLAMCRQLSWLPMGGWTRLPAGSTVDTAVNQLRYLMGRFQPMRTRLRLDASGEPSQVVFASGVIDLEVFESDEGDALAESIRLRYQNAPFDFERDWPVRMGVIVHEGTATHLIAIMCHLVSDGLGTGFMLADCATFNAEPLTTVQPLEQARWQETPAGQRQNTAALRHWERTLMAVPPLRFGETKDKPQPRHWRGDFRTPALRLAVHTISERSRVDSAQVLLAVAALAIHRASQISPVALRPMVSNRFRPGLSSVVAMVAQYGICEIGVAGLSFSEVLERCGRLTMTAYKHAYYDPADMTALIEQVKAIRGQEFEPGAYFNDRRAETRQGFPGPVPERQQILDVFGKGQLDWTIKQDDPFEPLILHVDDAPGAMNVVIFMDTHFISPSVAESLLRGMEEVAVEAAFDLLPGGVPHDRLSGRRQLLAR